MENRFLVVAHRETGISGCSRDSLLFFAQEIGKEIGVEWVGGARIFYRDENGNVADTDRAGFKQLARDGVVTPDTEVFDTTVQNVDAILQGRFALPAARCWHSRLMASAMAPA